MSRRPYRGISDSQANADALARRAAPYSAASEVSFRVRWDFHRREPSDLRDAVRMVRRAYSDEVPYELHEKGEDGIGEDGTPKWTAKANGYIFGDADSSDARKNPDSGQWDALGYFYSPFRAALDNLIGEHDNHPGHDSHPEGHVCGDPEHKRGLIVQHVTVGSQGPAEAAIKEGVPSWCAKLVAEDVLRAFLRNLSDVRIEMRRQTEAVA